MLTLYIGDKNYSSWSMRPWVAMRAAGIAFEEHVIRLGQDDTAQRIGSVSPSGRVPLLEDGEVRVWDSLAIVEYLAERYAECGLWPAQPPVRSYARCLAAEMHAGFGALRTHMPMNIRNRYPGQGRNAEVDADLARIFTMWQHGLDAFGGPFLCGAWCAADAFYAPVVTRLRTYAVDLPSVCEAYARAVERHPAVAAWVLGAHEDARAIARYDGIYR